MKSKFKNQNTDEPKKQVGFLLPPTVAPKLKNVKSFPVGVLYLERL